MRGVIKRFRPAYRLKEYGMGFFDRFNKGSELAKYRKALEYLEQCGEFNEAKFREVNRIAGGLYSEKKIKNFIMSNQIVSMTHSLAGLGSVNYAMDAAKSAMRSDLKKEIEKLEKVES